MPLFDFLHKSDKDKKNGGDEKLTQSFDRLTLAPREAQPVFVGGFDGKIASGSRQYYAPNSTPPVVRPGPGFPVPSPARQPSLPQPPSMYPYPVPVVPQRPANQPYSMTMQHAIHGKPARYSLPATPPRRQSNDAYFIPSQKPTIPTQAPVVNYNNLTVPNTRPPHQRPSSDPNVPSRPIPASLPSTPLKVPASSSPNLPKLTPPAARRPRANSTPASPTTATAGVTQCSGVTKAGNRCTRQVKAGPSLSVVHPEVQLERFCFQHTKEVMAPSGFYSRKNGTEWVKFEGMPLRLSQSVGGVIGCRLDTGLPPAGYSSGFENGDGEAEI